MKKSLKNQCFNPYLPSWEYIPDGEPRLFNGRVYVYGSHDEARGCVFCPGNYVCWSADENDLSEWRFEGEIYKKTDDPLNKDGKMNLYAPDVIRGFDGRYYLYYVLDKISIVSVAVCNKPAGKYEFYGYVSYPDGSKLGEKEGADGDTEQFDPAVILDEENAYLYGGFCNHGDKAKFGATVTVLEKDMLTVKEKPVFVIPSCYGEEKAELASGFKSFAGHEYFEAPSMRKFGELYYLVYSSVKMTELCYATSKSPNKDFVYRGVIVSASDLNIDSYKPAEKLAYPLGNNHGGLIKIGENFYIFYHRLTHGTWFSRQGCVEKIEVDITGGNIKQVETTSLGANGKPLIGRGEYPAYIACNLFNLEDGGKVPRITQDYKDKNLSFIEDISDLAVIGFKYFDCKSVSKVALKVYGYGRGRFELRLSPWGEAIGSIEVSSVNIWTEFSADIKIPDGVHALYFVYKSGNNDDSPRLSGFRLE